MDFTPPVFAVALSSLLSVMPFSTQAQTESRGLYATIYAQSTRLGSTMFDEIGNAGLGSGVKASFGAGLGLGGDIGFRYGNGWAAELEWNWRRHELKSLERKGTSLSSNGDFATNTFLINGVRRFVGQKGAWVPYLGAGVGWVQEIDFDIRAGSKDRAWSDGGKYALQVIGGAEIPIGNLWKLTTDVRMLRVGRVDLPAEEGVTGRLSQPRYNPISVQLGLRRGF